MVTNCLEELAICELRAEAAAFGVLRASAAGSTLSPNPSRSRSLLRTRNLRAGSRRTAAWSSRTSPWGSDCDHPDCEGADAATERPVLCFDCWNQWVAYDEEQLIEEAADQN